MEMRSVDAAWARLALLPIEAHAVVARWIRDAGPFYSPIDAHLYLRFVDALGRIARRRLSGEESFGPRSESIFRVRREFGGDCGADWDSILVPKVAAKERCYACAGVPSADEPFFSVSPMTVMRARMRLLLGSSPVRIAHLRCHRERTIGVYVWLLPSGGGGGRTRQKAFALRDDTREFSSNQELPISIDESRLESLMRECDRTLCGHPMVSTYWLRTLLEIDSRLFARQHEAIALPSDVMIEEYASYGCLCPACDRLENPAQCVRRRITDYAESLRRNHAARVEAAFRCTFECVPMPLPSDIFALVREWLQMRIDMMLEELRPLNHRLRY